MDAHQPAGGSVTFGIDVSIAVSIYTSELVVKGEQDIREARARGVSARFRLKDYNRTTLLNSSIKLIVNGKAVEGG